MKNVKSIAGSKGLSPLAGFGAEPQKNFAYTVGSAPTSRRGFSPYITKEAQALWNPAIMSVFHGLNRYWLLLTKLTKIKRSASVPQELCSHSCLIPQLFVSESKLCHGAMLVYAPWRRRYALVFHAAAVWNDGKDAEMEFVWVGNGIVITDTGDCTRCAQTENT